MTEWVRPRPDRSHLAALSGLMSPTERALFGIPASAAATTGVKALIADEDRRERARGLVREAGLPLLRSTVDRADELLSQHSRAGAKIALLSEIQR